MLGLVPQTLSQIKALLAERGLTPRHRFGQNFLHDPRKLEQIVAASQIKPGDTVLEVGPGTGTLTEAMLDAGASVIAVEIDRDLAALLTDRLGDSDRFTLINADVMNGKHALNPQVDAAIKQPPFTLIANLPYNIASPLLAVLAMDYPNMSRAIVMIQREVADRITGSPGNKQFGPLTVVLQTLCDVRRIATLPPGCFWPPPKVDSAVLELVRKAEPLSDEPHRVANFCQTLFTKRRKQLGSILGRGFAFPDDVDPTQRPEQLTVQQIVRMSRID